jgi:peptidoglycan/xylan/chitin deacetylase (PgdA/CDA1 family)
VVGYHGVCGERPDVADPAGMHVPAPLFEAQVCTLLNHYHPVSLGQVLACFSNGSHLPENPMLITSDDGYRNFLINGLPILRSRKVPCAFFPIVGALSSGEWPWFLRLAYYSGLKMGPFLQLCSDLMLLGKSERDEWLRHKGFAGNDLPVCDHSICGWEELGEAVLGGSIEVGSHSMSHPLLESCDAEELTYELAKARALLHERLNIKTVALAYPFGRFSLVVSSAAIAAGYKIAFQANGRHADPNDNIMAISRIMVGPDDSPWTLLSRTSGWLESLPV